MKAATWKRQANRRSIALIAIVSLVAGLLVYLGGSAAAQPPATPSIDVEKEVSVDGGATWLDADDPTGPNVTAGSISVFFRFTVTNTGDVALEDVELTDSDFAVPNNSVALLGVDQSFQRIIGPFAAMPGQHSNNATVTADVSGSAGNFGPDPHPYDGKKYSFTFLLHDGTLIEGTSDRGDADAGLSALIHVSCSDGFGFGDADPSNDGFGEQGAPIMGVDPPVVAYFITAFKRNGNVKQTCGGGAPQNVMDMDRAHYYGDVTPAIDIEKDVAINSGPWLDADDPTGPTAVAGVDQVFFRFTITNVGGQALTDLDVFELANTNYTFTFPQTVIDANTPLAAGDSFSFRLGPFLAAEGQHFNEVKVVAHTAAPTANFGPDPHPFSGKKRSYTFLLADGTLLEGTTNGGDAEVGLSTEIHVSCSDGFGFADADPLNDGFGEQGAPVIGVDPPVVAYFITAFKQNGAPKETCGGGSVPPPEMVMDQDPAHYFGERQAAKLGDRVWEDLDRDGVQDGGELGIPGVTVELLDQNMNPTGLTDVTDADGLYLFTGLAPGTYYLRFVNPDPGAWAFSPQDQGGDDAADSDANPDPNSPDVGKTAAILLDAGDDDRTWDAGLYRITRIGFQKLINGLDADDPNDAAGLPQVGAGLPITVEFAVELVSGVDVPASGIDVVDDVFGPIVTAGAPAPGVSGPAGDNGNGALEVGETWVYSLDTVAPTLPLAPGASVPGRCADSQPPDSQFVHKNTATVTVAGIDASDPAHLCVADIDIDKYTQAVVPGPASVGFSSNHLGADADDPNGADVPIINPGEQIKWNFVVSTGAGAVPIPAAQISVSDDTIGSIVTNGVPSAGVDGPAGDDSDGVLEPGEQWVYTASGLAADLSQPPLGVTVVPGCGDGRPTYENIGTVMALGLWDADPSHYCNGTPPLTIEKLTNGSDADGASDPDVPRVKPDDTVTWTYQVGNVGTSSLSEAQVVVTDSTPGVNPVRNPALGTHDGDTLLEPGETWTYEANGTALDLSQPPPAGTTVVAGCGYTDAAGNTATQNTYENVGRVDFPGGFDEDPSHYCNVLIDLEIEKDANPEEVVAGLPFDYEVTVTNVGPSPATNVVLLDLLPARCQPGSVGPLGLPCPVQFQTDPPFAGSFAGFPAFGDYNGGANPANAVNDPAFQIDNPDISPFSERQKPQGGAFVSVSATGGAACAYDAGVHGVRCDLASLASGAWFTVTITMTMDPFARVRVWNRAWTFADETNQGLEPNTIKEAGTPCGDSSNTDGWPADPSSPFPQPAGPGCNYAKKNITIAAAPDARYPQMR